MKSVSFKIRVKWLIGMIAIMSISSSSQSIAQDLFLAFDHLLKVPGFFHLDHREELKPISIKVIGGDHSPVGLPIFLFGGGHRVMLVNPYDPRDLIPVADLAPTPDGRVPTRSDIVRQATPQTPRSEPSLRWPLRLSGDFVSASELRGSELHVKVPSLKNPDRGAAPTLLRFRTTRHHARLSFEMDVHGSVRVNGNLQPHPNSILQRIYWLALECARISRTSPLAGSHELQLKSALKTHRLSIFPLNSGPGDYEQFLAFAQTKGPSARRFGFKQLNATFILLRDIFEYLELDPREFAFPPEIRPFLNPAPLVGPSNLRSFLQMIGLHPALHTQMTWVEGPLIENEGESLWNSAKLIVPGPLAPNGELQLSDLNERAPKKSRPNDVSMRVEMSTNSDSVDESPALREIVFSSQDESTIGLRTSTHTLSSQRYLSFVELSEWVDPVLGSSPLTHDMIFHRIEKSVPEKELIGLRDRFLGLQSIDQTLIVGLPRTGHHGQLGLFKIVETLKQKRHIGRNLSDLSTRRRSIQCVVSLSGMFPVFNEWTSRR